MHTWHSRRYLQFGAPRTRPAEDLLARVPVTDPGAVVDVGCGPGNSTRLLADRWPEAAITGIDSSAAMLEQAAVDLPGTTFLEADLREWSPPAPVDVVFSNATLQWVEDHPSVLGHLLSWLAPGGALAVQMPDNYASPSHVLMRRLASDQRWEGRLGGVLRAAPVAPAETYHRLLRPHGEVDLWTTEYLHVLEGEDPVLEWLRGTGLRPILDRLDRSEADEFATAYAASLREAYPRQEDGTTLFPFRRIFFVLS